MKKKASFQLQFLQNGPEKLLISFEKNRGVRKSKLNFFKDYHNQVSH